MIYLITGRIGSGKEDFVDTLVKKGLPETTLFEDDIADMTAKICQVSPDKIVSIVSNHPYTAFKIINIDADDMDRRLNFVRTAENKLKAEQQFDALDKAEYDMYNGFEEKIRRIDEDPSWIPENLIGIHNYLNDSENGLDAYADEIVHLNKLHNRVVNIVDYLADGGVIEKYPSKDKCIKVNTDKGYMPTDCFADIILSNDSRFAELLRVYLSVATSIGDVDNVTEPVDEPDRPVTTRSEMKHLHKGDKFYVNGCEHTASTDSHFSGDTTCNEHIVYDESDESWFETDFPED